MAAAAPKSRKLCTVVPAVSGGSRNGVVGFMQNDTICHVRSDGTIQTTALEKVPASMCLRLACAETAGTFVMLCPDSGLLVGTAAAGALYCIEWKAGASPLSYSVQLSEVDRSQHGLSGITTIMDLPQVTRAALVPTSVLTVGGVIYISYPGGLRRLPYEADVYSNHGSIAEYTLPLGGFFTLAALHDGQTIACVCSKGVMLIPGSKDNLLSTKRSALRFSMIHLCNFPMDSEQPDVTRACYPAANVAVPWHAEHVIAYGDKDYLFVQLLDGTVMMLVVPYVGALKVALKAPRAAVAGTFDRMTDAVVSDDVDNPVASLVFSDGFFQVSVRALLAKEYTAFLRGQADGRFKPFAKRAKFANALSSDATILLVDGVALDSETLAKQRGTVAVSTHFAGSI